MPEATWSYRKENLSAKKKKKKERRTPPFKQTVQTCKKWLNCQLPVTLLFSDLNVITVAFS